MANTSADMTDKELKIAASRLFRNLRIPLAEGLMVWPPDGLASPAAQR